MDVFVLDHRQSMVFWHEQGCRGPRDAEGPGAVRDRVYCFRFLAPISTVQAILSTELPIWDADTG